MTKKSIKIDADRFYYRLQAVDTSSKLYVRISRTTFAELRGAAWFVLCRILSICNCWTRTGDFSNQAYAWRNYWKKATINRAISRLRGTYIVKVGKGAFCYLHDSTARPVRLEFFKMITTPGDAAIARFFLFLAFYRGGYNTITGRSIARALRCDIATGNALSCWLAANDTGNLKHTLRGLIFRSVAPFQYKGCTKDSAKGKFVGISILPRSKRPGSENDPPKSIKRKDFKNNQYFGAWPRMGVERPPGGADFGDIAPGAKGTEDRKQARPQQRSGGRCRRLAPQHDPGTPKAPENGEIMPVTAENEKATMATIGTDGVKSILAACMPPELAAKIYGGTKQKKKTKINPAYLSEHMRTPHDPGTRSRRLEAIDKGIQKNFFFKKQEARLTKYNT